MPLQRLACTETLLRHRQGCVRTEAGRPGHVWSHQRVHLLPQNNLSPGLPDQLTPWLVPSCRSLTNSSAAFRLWVFEGP